MSTHEPSPGTGGTTSNDQAAARIEELEAALRAAQHDQLTIRDHIIGLEAENAQLRSVANKLEIRLERQRKRADRLVARVNQLRKRATRLERRLAATPPPPRSFASRVRGRVARAVKG